VIDGHYSSKVSRSSIRRLLDDALAGFPKPGVDEDSRAFPIEVSCPCCNHSLMDDEFLIDGRPAIRCSVSFDGRHGWLRLSSLYGSAGTSAEHDIPPGAVVRFFCPHCHARLEARSACETCQAPMVPMMIRGGGIVQFCSRRGCTHRMLDLI
jgi:hypothetical protein